MELDNKVTDIEARKKIVEEYLAENPEPSNRELTQLANYLLFCGEYKSKGYLSNKEINKIKGKETSLDKIMEQNVNGEDVLQSQRSRLGRNEPKNLKHKITAADYERNQDLCALQRLIEDLENKFDEVPSNMFGRLKKMIVELKKDKFYVYRGFHLLQPKKNKVVDKPIDLSEELYIDADGDIQSTGIISLIREADVKNIIKNYALLESLSPTFTNQDLIFLHSELSECIENYLKAEYSLLYTIFKRKVLGKTNFQISKELSKEYNMEISGTQISVLFGKKIPHIIAEYFRQKYIVWYYTEKELGKWKKCGKCGEVKLVHRYFFARNQLSGNSFYSICKECRRKKEGGHSIKWQLK